MNTNSLNDFFLLIDSYIGGAQWFVTVLLLTGLFFTIYLKFPQIRFFRHAISVLLGKYDKAHHEGDTSHFQSLATALSGTIGTGNIAGVALAIHLGGPSALFWMLMTACLGMTTKMVEVTLSHKYRQKADDGTISGGPMYYMRDRLKMKWLAVIFAVATILSSFGTGSLPQINSISNSFFATFGIDQWITGAVLSIILAIIIFGGVKRIVKSAEMLMPFMTIVFIIGSILTIIYNYQNVIPSIESVFSNIFSGTSATGGFLGAGFAWAFNRGVNRGLFSNEAGQGSAPIAHAAARTDEPVSEGMVALLEPFIDTVIVCMITGIVILSSGVWNEKFENKFQMTDMVVLDGRYDENNLEDKNAVADFINRKGDLTRFSGEVNIAGGVITTPVTIIHSRSFADSVRVLSGGHPFEGVLTVVGGSIKDTKTSLSNIEIIGKSLIHSAPLSTEAVGRSFFGKSGKILIPICLLLFAFTTAIAWFYYASRAIIFLWGTGPIIIFQFIYVIAFFVASFVDTSLVWSFSGITIAFMTIPNLIGILLLRKEVKQMVTDYTNKFIRKSKNSN